MLIRPKPKEDLQDCDMQSFILSCEEATGQPGSPGTWLLYHTTTSVWKLPLSWHWTGHPGDYWQQAELCTEKVQVEQ